MPVSKSFNESYKTRTPESRHCNGAIKNIHVHCKWLKYNYCRTIDNLEQYKVTRNHATYEL